jgi:hypothetical protein
MHAASDRRFSGTYIDAAIHGCKVIATIGLLILGQRDVWLS